MSEHAELHDSTGSQQPVKRTPCWYASVAALFLLALAGIAAFMMARKPAIPARTLDLRQYHHTPAAGFVNRQFPWGAVPRGKHTFGNVPLAIDGAMYLWGAANAQRGLVFAERVDDIVVDRKFETLYVYHGTFMSAAEGAPVYHLIMHYADGTSNEQTICYGVHVRDWYEGPESKTTLSDPKSVFVWRTDHPYSTRPIKLRFSITSLPNPKPSLVVKSINLASAKGNAAGCILAMTTGPSDLLKPALEVDPADSK